ncbi:hypothetical protein F9288_08375 [Sphingomonas sp. CL5.1]|nr:hypothetical protein F9288_08375 [Sphingomonas sp. CL5.1]
MATSVRWENLARAHGVTLLAPFFRVSGQDRCEEIDFMVRLLHGAIRSKAAGINILTLGPPGVGKTELARTLAAELLTWLDRHPLPVIAATNHAHKLDPAALRRFVFKLDLRPFGKARVARAFDIFFGVPALLPR